LLQRLVESQKIELGPQERRLDLRQVGPVQFATGLRTGLVAGMLDEDPPHGLGGRSEEVTTAIPALAFRHLHQSQVRLVDQGRGLQGLARLLLGHAITCQLAQLVVDQRQQLRGGVRIALLDRRQDARDVSHGWHQRGWPRLACLSMMYQPFRHTSVTSSTGGPLSTGPRQKLAP
jgi:hypothetical protein